MHFQRRSPRSSRARLFPYPLSFPASRTLKKSHPSHKQIKHKSILIEHHEQLPTQRFIHRLILLRGDALRIAFQRPRRHSRRLQPPSTLLRHRLRPPSFRPAPSSWLTPFLSLALLRDALVLDIAIRSRGPRRLEPPPLNRYHRTIGRISETDHLRSKQSQERERFGFFFRVAGGS
jgi:hypothetical protein